MNSGRLGLILVLFCGVSLAVVSLAGAVERAQLDPFDGFTVTEIKLEGNSVTKEYVITREMRTHVGEALIPNIVLSDVQRLDNLGIFADIQLDAYAHEKGVGLTYTFRELPWMIPYLKFKFTEENGWSVGPTVTSVNMFGRDIYLTGFLLFGGTTTFSIRFTHPWIMDDRVSLDIIAEHLQRTNKLYDFEETSDEATFWFGKWIGDKGRTRFGFSYFAVASEQDGKTLSSNNRDNMYRGIGAVGYDSRDSWQNPHDGWDTEIEVIATGGDAQFVTSTVDLRRYLPVSTRQTVALGVLSSLQGGTVGTDIPEYMQYNMGGANTIRGYDINKLGPVLFGQNQFILTAEYQFLLMPIKAYDVLRWAVSGGLEAAAFMDFGTAWSNIDQLDSDRFKTGFGFGLRPLVPGINVVRFDVGMNTHGDVLFHFGLWSKFDAQRLRLR